MSKAKMSVEDVLISLHENARARQIALSSGEIDAKELLKELHDNIDQALAQLYELLTTESKRYTLQINLSDGYEVTEDAIPLETINRLFGRES